MHIGVLAYERDDPESIDLEEVGREIGHDTTLFVLDDVSCASSPDGGLLPRIAGVPASEFDVVLSRARIRPDRAQLDYDRYAMLCHVDGLTVLDPASVYLEAESKFLGLQRLSAAGLPIAPTRSCASVADVEQAFAEWGPIVLKPSFGLGGVDVERIRDRHGCPAAAERLLAAYEQVVCQPYFPHPDGDVRVTIVGGRAPLVVHRVPAASDWRANVNMGAVAVPADVSPELIDISRRAAEVMGVTVAGLDFLPTGDGYRIVEFNNTPSWEFAERSVRHRIVEDVVEVAQGIHRARRTGPASPGV
ncbi:ATP-grasp domain-containing protein [Pseudonocardia phyllosphaerae]|uniref:ATP-grasp domain-containing protein n=1 Tax=Pseudonocardia phyllosphaerae TaxID=3390502 RepID=UPI00397E3DAC